MAVVRNFVPYVFLFLWTAFTVKSCAFCTTDSLGIMMNKVDNRVHVNESFINSSIWVYHQQKGLRLRPSRPSFFQLILVLCGDIKTCPGPVLKCRSCSKTIRRNQSRATCTRCNEHLHLKGLTQHMNENLCLSCLSSIDHGTATIYRDADSINTNLSYEIPELTELQRTPGLKILHQNIRGILAHIDSIYHLMGSFKNIHIFSLSETHLTSQNETQVKIPGFHYINKPRKSRAEKGGGVGAYVASYLPYQRREDLEHPEVECIWLEFLFPKSRGILICIIYRPPDSSKYLPNQYEEKLRSMLELVSIENKEILMLGDLNCNYLANSDHKEIKHIISASGLKQLITSPTRITNQSSTLIDVICSNEPQNISITKVIPAGLRDHEMVGCAR